MERKCDYWERRARLWGTVGREPGRQSPRNCSSDGVTMRCAAAAAALSLLSTDDWRYVDFPAFQCWGGREKQSLEVRRRYEERLEWSPSLTLLALIRPMPRRAEWRWCVFLFL